MTIETIADMRMLEEYHPLTVRNKEKDLIWLRYIQPHLNGIEEPRILDAGCLFGDFLTLMPNNIIGVEVIPQAVQTCRERRLNAVVSDLSKRLPFNNDTFDFIHCWAVVEHLTREANWNAFREFYRILKPDGKLLVMTGDIKKAGIDFMALSIDHQTFFSKQSMEEVARLSGFSKLKISHLIFQRGSGVLAKFMTPKNVMRVQDFYTRIGLTGNDLILEAWK